MPNLKCHEYSCKFNKATHCIIKTLSVSKSAYCNDYERRKEDDKSTYDYEFAYDHGMSLKQDEHRIICNDLACLNNNSGDCRASYIRIDTYKGCAHCCQVREENNN